MIRRTPLTLLALLVVAACGDLSDVRAVALYTAYTPDGHLIVSTEAGIKIYGADMAKEEKSIEIKRGFPPPGGSSEPGLFGYSLSANGEVAAVATMGPAESGKPEEAEIALFQIPTGQALGRIKPQLSDKGPYVTELNLVLSPAGDMVYVFNLDGKMYSTSDGSLLWNLSVGPLSYSPCVFVTNISPIFSPDGKTIYVTRGQYLVAVETATGVGQVLLDAQICIGGVRLLSDRVTLLVVRTTTGTTDAQGLTTPQQDFYAFYSTDGNKIGENPQFADFFTSDPPSFDVVTCSPVENICAGAVEQRSSKALPSGDIETASSPFVLIWRLDGTLLHTISVPSAAASMAFSPDGRELAIAAESARIYSVADGSLLQERSYTYGVF